MSSSNLTHRSNCPLCNSPSLKDVFDCEDFLVSKEYFTIAECQNCSFRFTKSVPPIHLIQNYYASDDYTPHTARVTGFKMHAVYWARILLRLPAKKRWIQKITGKKDGTLLDFGCGSGEFPAMMQKAGWKVTAIEPNEEMREHCRNNLGVDCRDLNSFSALPEATFDVISLWHVLEHVHDIHGTMDTVYRLLKPDGVCFIAIPNYDSAQADMYGAEWFAYDVPRHISHFNAATFKRFAEMHGLHIFWKTSLWLDPFYFAYYCYRYGKRNFLWGLWTVVIDWCSFVGNTSRAASPVFAIKKSNMPI